MEIILSLTDLEDYDDMIKNIIDWWWYNKFKFYILSSNLEIYSSL